jgi:hypothetical protein
MPRNAARVRRKSWAAIGGTLALVTIAGLTLACNRKSHIPPPPPPDAQRPVEPPIDVLVWMESTPPGAHVVKVSNNQSMGWTPETMEFTPSPKPELIRFELQGYLPLTIEVPVDKDSELAVVLKPVPTEHSAANKKSKRTKARAKSK